MRVLKTGSRNTKSLAYTSLVRPILENGSACWDPCREGQINALDRVQKKAAQFTNHVKDSDWETLAQRRTIARLCELFKAYCGKGAWNVIRDRLRRAYYLSRSLCIIMPIFRRTKALLLHLVCCSGSAGCCS